MGAAAVTGLFRVREIFAANAVSRQRPTKIVRRGQFTLVRGSRIKDRRIAWRAIRIARIPAAKFIRYLSVAEPTEKGLHKAVKVSTEVYITPSDEYKKLDDEFRFEFDACPYPRPRGFNALKILWKKTNFVNPPFSAKHNAEPDHHGPTDYVRKAIAEQRLGNTSVLTLPTPNYVNMLIEAGAEVWALGRIKYLEAKTGKPHPNPPFITRFVLRGHSNVKSS